MSTTPTPSIAASIGHGREAPPMPRVEAPAHRIRNDAEAIAVARRLAEQFAEESAVRDREGRLPYQEIDVFSQSGLWGISVPKNLWRRRGVLRYPSGSHRHYFRRRFQSWSDPTKSLCHGRSYSVKREGGSAAIFFSSAC